MNESTTSFSYSFSLKQPQRKATGDAPRWMFAGGTAYPLSASHVVLKNVSAGTAFALTGDFLAALQTCVNFRPLSEHAARICGLFPALEDHRQEVLKTLEQAATQGMLITEASLFDRLNDPGTGPEMDNRLPVVVRTCDRPALLVRLLESLRENEIRYGNRYRYTVIDQSRDSANRQQNEENVAAARDKGLRVSCYGADAQAALIGELMRALPDNPEIVSWLLDAERHAERVSPGRSFNHALLGCAGKRFLSIDDDAICRALESPGAADGIEISPRLRDARFSGGGPSLAETARPVGIDILQQHTASLGSTLGAVVASRLSPEGAADAFRHLTSDQLNQLSSDSTIGITTNGTFGDPGIDSPHWLYDLTGESRDSLLTSGAGYLENRSRRNLWVGRGKMHLGFAEALMTTTLTGIDNRSCLPPCFPYFRNEDFMLGAGLRFVCPQAMALEFPWGLEHRPAPERVWELSALDRPMGLGMQHFLADYATQAASHCYADRDHLRVRALGDLYADLSAASDESLGGLLQEFRLHARSAIAKEQRERMGEVSDVPAQWRADIQKVVDVNTQGAVDVEEVMMSELADCRPGEAQTLQDLRAALQDYSKAIHSWSALREASRAFFADKEWFSADL